MVLELDLCLRKSNHGRYLLTLKSKSASRIISDGELMTSWTSLDEQSSETEEVQYLN
jgi:hypothetical protein